jgi:hypothetical protein
LSYSNLSEFELHIYSLDCFLFVVAKEEGDQRSSFLIFNAAKIITLVLALAWVEGLPASRTHSGCPLTYRSILSNLGADSHSR